MIPPAIRGSTGSAAGKVILVGEHAVVYGTPGIALPLSGCRAQAVLSPSEGAVRVVAPDLGQAARLGEAAPAPSILPLLRTVELVRRSHPEVPGEGWELSVRSAIPIQRGLGSGAAITTAALRAMDGAFRLGLEPRTLIELTFEIEKLHHGRPSGIDNTVVGLEHPILFRRGEPPVPVEAPPLLLLVGDSGRAQDTGEMVARVARRRREEPREVERVIQEIHGVVLEALAALEDEDLPALGGAMDRNHRLLVELGVSTPGLDRLVEASRAAGALGAKLTGAGGGGSVIALATDVEKARRVEGALRDAGASQVLLPREQGGYP